jgi:hypothetical protein
MLRLRWKFDLLKYFLPVCLALLVGLVSTPSWAQEEEEEEEKLGWTNSTDLSLVVTDGNSSTETLGFNNLLRRRWSNARYSFQVDGVRSNTSDDPFAFFYTDDPDGEIEVFFPSKSPDVERYFIENRYDRNITERFFWNVGASWERNKDAGILNRYIGFAGVGNIWWSREDLEFSTTYGLSYTDREDETPDPEKDDSFIGFRFGWEYENQWGKVTTYRNLWNITDSLEDTSDYYSDMVNSISVAINSRLALKVSLQWLYNSIPGLQDVTLYAIDRKTGLKVEEGEVQIRKEKLDTIFRTSLVVNF